MSQELDPEVQVVLADIANQWVEANSGGSRGSTGWSIEDRIENFDKAYKGLAKTVKEE